MRRTALFTSLGLAGAALVAAGLGAMGLLAAPHAAKAQAAGGGVCAGLAAPGLFQDATVASARAVASDPAKGAPAFCEVTAVITPAPGSHIGVVYRLPEGWNGELLGLGGGGWAGNVRIEAALAGLKRGFATAQTDGGHAGTDVWDNAWASSPEPAADFAYRAIHLMTVVGKQVVARYYGKPQSKALYQGCSTGGRQGLMEVQRFPDDYDGVIAGAPVYNLLVQTSAVVRNQLFGAPGAGLTEDQLLLVNKAVLAACDARDGLADGLISDPRSCDWDPAQIQCKAGETAGCLTASQVTALRTSYDGVQTIDGRTVAWPLARGGEAGWARFMQINGASRDATNGGGMGTLAKIITGDPSFDIGHFDPGRDLPKIRSSAFARAYEANDPAIGAFVRHGGKLILWHGWSDAGPSPIGTIAYYNQVQGSTPGAADSVRFYLEPGVYHCGGGPGADQVDFLGALDQWVKTGRAPETLLATKANSKMSRPLCRFPTKPVYKGSGDPDAASSFDCR